MSDDELASPEVLIFTVYNEGGRFTAHRLNMVTEERVEITDDVQLRPITLGLEDGVPYAGYFFGSEVVGEQLDELKQRQAEMELGSNGQTLQDGSESWIDSAVPVRRED